MTYAFTQDVPIDAALYQRVIDGLGPNGFARTAYATGRNLVKTQTGYVYHYAFVMLLGVAGLLSYALFAFGGAG